MAHTHRRPRPLPELPLDPQPCVTGPSWTAWQVALPPGFSEAHPHPEAFPGFSKEC